MSSLAPEAWATIIGTAITSGATACGLIWHIGKQAYAMGQRDERIKNLERQASDAEDCAPALAEIKGTLGGIKTELARVGRQVDRIGFRGSRGAVNTDEDRT